jgi:hypothetical protein
MATKKTNDMEAGESVVRDRIQQAKEEAKRAKTAEDDFKGMSGDRAIKGMSGWDVDGEMLGGKKCGGSVKGYKSGGTASRGDGCAIKGHTKGRMI